MKLISPPPETNRLINKSTFLSDEGRRTPVTQQKQTFGKSRMCGLRG